MNDIGDAQLNRFLYSYWSDTIPYYSPLEGCREHYFKLVIIYNINTWLLHINTETSYYRESSIWSFLDYCQIELDWVFTAWQINSCGNLYYRRGSSEARYGHQLERMIDQSIKDFATAVYLYETNENAASFSKWQYEYDHLISLNHETIKEGWERNVNMMIEYDANKLAARCLSGTIQERFQYQQATHRVLEPLDEEYIRFVAGFRGSTDCCLDCYEFYDS